MIPSFQRSGVSCALLCLSCLAAGTTALRAGSATWAAQPKDNLWDNSANWNPETIPDESGDVATFGQSSITAISASVGLIRPDGGFSEAKESVWSA
ncbi:MAG TPA: hypothetical protein VGG02_13280 [Chthoniobacterales bacterium]|jgi:hypothetical protein